jgi:predicted nucleotidyltransferase
MDDTKIPNNVKIELDKLAEQLTRHLGGQLVGIYLHGSLAMGGFNPISSDVDILVVVQNKLSLENKKEIGQIMLDLSKSAPGKGYELSIITLDSLQNFTYPTPFEFHFSDSNKEAFEKGTVDLSDGKTDPDLAAHFVITKHRGVCLYGKPIDEIFSEVPKHYYLDSLLKDAEWSYEKMASTPDDELSLPVYGVLNFCRVLALIKAGVITSKIEGGEWALKNLPQHYHPLIKEALKEKVRSGAGIGVVGSLVKNFANYAIAIIREATRDTL